MSLKWFSKQNFKELMPDNKGVFSRIFDSMKYRDFRLYFYGQCVSQTGTWMQQIAMSWLVYRMTGSVVLLGTVVFLAQIPILFVTPFLSVFVDRYDKRKILLLTQSLSLLQAAILATMLFTHTISVEAIMALSLFLGCVNALDMPTRQSFYPSLVPQDKLNNAIAMNSAIVNGSRLVGPAIGGFVVQVVGEGGCFLINAISFLFVLWALWLIRPVIRPIQPSDKKILEQLLDGFHYVKNSLPIRTMLIMISVFSFCAFNSITLIPAYVKDTLHGNSMLLGFMMACFGVGAFGAALFLAARKSVLGLGNIVVIALLLSAGCIIPLFFVHEVWVAMLLAMWLGFGLVGGMASLNTLLQALSDYTMRGRVMGYYTMGFIGCSAIGSLFWSWMSKLIGLHSAMLISGGLCGAAALIFNHFRPIIRQQARAIYIEKGIIDEIAIGIDSTTHK